MKICLNKNLVHLENVIISERHRFLKNSSIIWKGYYDRNEQFFDEQERMQSSKIAEYSALLSNIKLNLEEMTRSNRIRLENKSDTFLNYMQRYKTRSLLTYDQLNYNYQVFPKQLRENLIIINENKRQLVQIKTKIIKTKEQIKDTANAFDTQSSKLRATIIQLESRFTKTENSINHKAALNIKKVMRYC